LLSSTSLGTTMPRANLKLLRKILVPTPPVEEQQVIVNHLDALRAKVDLLRNLQARTAEELEQMSTSYLDNLFKRIVDS
jgi:restriction endonuclease S subunit